MKIGFDFVCDEAPIFSKVGEHFQKEGHQVFGLTMGQRWSKWWKGKYTTHKIDAVYNGQIDIGSEFERIQKQYGRYAPASYLIADRHLNTKPREYQRFVFVNTFRLVEDAFKIEKPDYYFSTGVAFLYNLITLAVCQKNNIPHISLYSTRGHIPKFTVSLGNGGSWDLVDEEYKLLQITKEYETSEYEKTQTYLRLFREKAQKPFYMTVATQSHSLKLIFIKEFIQRLRYWIIDGWGKEKGDYITRPPWWYVKRDVVKLLRARILAIQSDRIFDKSNVNDKYFLFPLHLQPEASTLILSEWYVDQLETIKNISKALPLDTILYVKEHISAFGRHTSKFYNAIKAIHNVRLIAPNEYTPDLIRNSLGVIVLSSTVGWEAALFNRPVFVLGQVFYRTLNGVEAINNFDELREKLLVYRDEEKRLFPGNNEENILMFLIAINRQSFDGLFDVAKMDLKEVVTAADNIKNVHFALSKFIEKIDVTTCTSDNQVKSI